METTAILLNSQSILDCVESNDIIEHSNEMKEIIKKITKHKDYPCALLCKYQDEYYKKYECEIYSCNISEIFEELERFDIKNGVDLYLDRDGYLNFIIYGQRYFYKERDYMMTMAMKVLPINEDKNFLNMSDVILKKGNPKVSE